VDKNVAPTVAIEYRIRGSTYLSRVTQSVIDRSFAGGRGD
jgi:hypothetical protein